MVRLSNHRLLIRHIIIIRFAKKLKVADQVAEFYDKYSESQRKTGVHIRHYTILKKLKAAGLKSDSKILEIGCGIGTLTGLLAGFVREGKVICTDISPESISIAKSLNSNYSNIEYFVTDMSDFKPSDKFDFIVFPDVLEHIPKEQHNNIFRNISKSIHPESKVAVHIPDPINLQYVRDKTPELLQIIDQPLFIEDFAAAVKDTPFMVEIYERYCLFNREPDYNWLLFSVKRSYNTTEKQSRYKLKIIELFRRYF